MVTLNTGKEEYVIKYTTRVVVDLEEKLGNINLLSLFSRDSMPTLKQLLIVLHCGIVTMNHGVKFDDMYSIYDDYLANGGSFSDMIRLIVKGLQEGGVIPKFDSAEESKN